MELISRDGGGCDGYVIGGRWSGNAGSSIRKEVIMEEIDVKL